MELIMLIVGLIIGVGLMYFVAKQNSRRAEQLAQAQADTLHQSIDAFQLRLNDKETETKELVRVNARMEAENAAMQLLVNSNKEEIEQTKRTFQIEFENIANRLFEEKSKKFTDINQTNIASLLKPLSENIETFRKRVDEVYDKESKERFSLGREVQELVKMNQLISQEANNLTKALKGDSKIQGDWGEMILESILEKSGLTRNREYFIQESTTNEEGKRFRPDVVVAYPDNRKVVVDSKVSLVAYERFASAETKEDQERFLKEHLRSLKAHIDSLSSKDYGTLVDGSLDFTMLFVAVEPAYMLALQSDNDLWNYAYQKKILLISPTNLIASLKLIADMWKRDNQSKNAMEIATRGAQLYDKFYGFVKNMDKIGENLKRTQTSFDDAMGQLSVGRGNLIGQVDKLRKLGAKPKNLLTPDTNTDEDDE